ncbi:MerR family transcriptional regulator [Paenibacillus spiritus]|uniref:MerR family transcriptional regulator n=1 Tax=Paenibacillus spiritus TaxID=2496557 RepID=A0A5J5GDK4_9BACL|nr:MerR family transcriptional regulator [Paenibacillus spiritus]KAA9005872.1 MerR family transcriptional regulator [Paenibacillus spiritus]
MKINELSEKTGLTPPTIRFYEKEGLLDHRHVQRLENNYRDYSDDAVRHLNLLKRFQSVGFSLDELKEINQETAGNQFTLAKSIEVLRNKMLEIERKREEFDQIYRTLEEMLGHKAAMMKDIEGGTVRRTSL